MRNFVIVGTQRTGSSALGELIGNHPTIACGWEWTQYSSWGKKLSIAEQGLRGRFDALSTHHRRHMSVEVGAHTVWLGFRRLFGASHLWLIHPRYSLTGLRDRFSAHLNWFGVHPDLHIIHIVRWNNVDWLKSKFMAEKTQHFIGSTYPDGISIRIPIHEAIARLKSKEWIDHRLAALRESNPYLCLAYEDLLANPQEVASRAFSFLNCDAVHLPTREQIIRRQSDRSAADYIVNYHQLVKELSRRGFMNANHDDLPRDIVHETE